MAEELDLEHRDINALNSHVQVAFHDVLGEPDEIHSADCVWNCSYKCFNCTLNCCYKVLTFICAIPMSFMWGCEFACLAFCHVWHSTPCFKLCSIDMFINRKMIQLCLDTFVGPCCETCALMFSRINVANASSKSAVRKSKVTKIKSASPPPAKVSTPPPRTPTPPQAEHDVTKVE